MTIPNNFSSPVFIDCVEQENIYNHKQIWNDMSYTFEIYNKETEKIQYEDSAYRIGNISFGIDNGDREVVYIICDTIDF